MGQTITFEIPDWAMDRRVRIQLGRENYIIRQENGDVYKKVVRCNLCGHCCLTPGKGWPFGDQEIDGELYCAKVAKVNGEFFCECGWETPCGCASEHPLKKLHKECCITWEKVE